MSGIRDTATVTLNVNGAQAKQFMADLEKQIQDTEAAIVDMQKKMADPKDIEKAKKQLKTYKKQLDEMRSATEGVNRALENIELATPRELEKALRTLNRQMKDMVPGSEVWDSHIEKIRELKARLSDIKDEMGEQQSLWEKFNDWATQVWPSIDLLSRGYDALVSGMRNYVDAYADMEQEMANVRKFTGMTEEQVASLNEEFKKIDTRSSREQLNLLAQEAGRLGKTSEEDVLGFARAADKINVALDDLGEGATLTLSKLTGIFGDEARYGTEQSLLKVGSVINELSQNCSASAPYLANFAERMGGVGAQARLTIPQIMGFAAVLDTNAQKVEASATALSQIIVRLYQDPAKYAKVAGLDAQEFASLMREDANAALILFLETLEKAGGMDTLSPMFKDMGENGSRAISALSTLATHIDMVKAQQEAANVAFEEGKSIDIEFAVQNNTVQATLEKCKNKANELRVELGEYLYPVMSHVLTTSSAILRVLLTTIRFILDHKTAVASLAAGVAAYTVVVNAAIIKEKLWIAISTAGRVAMTLWTAAVKLGAAAIALFSGNVRKARLIWISFNATLSTSPWGMLAAAIALVVAALISFTRQSSFAEIQQKKLAAAEKEAETNARKEMAETDRLYKKTQDITVAMKDRLAAAEELKRMHPTTFANLTAEAIAAGQAADAYKQLTDNMLAAAKAEAYKKVISSNMDDIVDYESQVEAQLNTFAYDPRYSDIVNDPSRSNKEKVQAMRAVDQKALESHAYVNAYYTPGTASNAGRREDISRLESLVYKIDTLEGQNTALERKINSFSMPTNATTTADGADGSGDTGGTGGGVGGSTQTTDRFAKEKAARESEEALARIAYAKGEKTYEEHTTRMNEIAVEYYQSILERQDLSDQERLTTLAQYWEAVNKKNKDAIKNSVEEENESYQQSLFNLNESLRQRLEAGNLSAEEREKIEKTHREAVELAELNHLALLVDMYEEGSAERLKAEQAYQAAQLAARKRHQQEYEDEEAKFAKIKADYFGDNPQERQQKYDTAFDALKIVYERELAAAGENTEEKLRIEEAFLQAQNELRRQYGLESEEDTRNSMQRAVDASVEWLNSDGGKALTGTLSTLTSGMSSIFSGLSTMMQAELEIQTAQIEKRYDREISLAQGNSYKVAKLEKKKEAEIAKAKNDANKKMFAMQVIQAVAQTAQNAISAYGSAAAVPVVGHTLAPVAAAMAVAAGAIQIAAIKKQQQAAEAKGYSAGGFTKPGRVDEPAGIVHAGEWVASQKLLANPVARPMIESLDYVQRTNTIGSLRAEDVSRSITANNSLVRIAEGNNGTMAMIAVANKMSGAVSDLTDRLNEPFVTVNTVTGSKGIKSAQDEYDRLMSNKSPKSKRNGSNH